MLIFAVLLVLIICQTDKKKHKYEIPDYPPMYPEDNMKDQYKLVLEKGQRVQIEMFGRADSTCDSPSRNSKGQAIKHCVEVGKCLSLETQSTIFDENTPPHEEEEIKEDGNVTTTYTKIIFFQIWLFKDLKRDDSFRAYVDYFNDDCRYSPDYVGGTLYDDAFNDVQLGQCMSLRGGKLGRYYRVYHGCPMEDFDIMMQFRTIWLGCGILLPCFIFCCCCLCCSYNNQKCLFCCYTCCSEFKEETKDLKRLGKTLTFRKTNKFKSFLPVSMMSEDLVGDMLFSDAEIKHVDEDEDEDEDEIAGKGANVDDMDDSEESTESEDDEEEGQNEGGSIVFEDVEMMEDGDADAALPDDIEKESVETSMEDHVYDQGKIESEKLMNPIWWETESELRNYRNVKEQCCLCCRAIKGFFVSLIMIIYLETKKLLAVYMAFVCFLNADYSQEDVYYPSTKMNVTNYQIFFIGVFILYIVVQGTILTFWIRSHIISPFKVTLLLGLYNEWIYYRVLLSFMYLFYLVYGIPAFLSTNSRVLNNINTEIRQTWDEKHVAVIFSTSFWSLIVVYLKFGFSVLLLVAYMLRTLNYDGFSSINYYHRIKNTTSAFPYINYYAVTWFKSPDENLATLILMFSLITGTTEEKIQEDIQTYAGSTDFGHLSWKMIKGLNWKEIIFLKYKIFSIEDMDNIQLKSEEELGDTLKYIPPTKPVWWRACLCFTCCLCLRRFDYRVQSTRIALEEKRLNRQGSWNTSSRIVFLKVLHKIVACIMCGSSANEKTIGEQRDSKIGSKGFERLKDEIRMEVTETKKKKKMVEYEYVLKRIKKQNSILRHRTKQLSLGHDHCNKDERTLNQIEYFVKENEWLRGEIIKLRIKNFREYYNTTGVDLSHGLLQEGYIDPREKMKQDSSDDDDHDNDSNKKNKKDKEEDEDHRKFDDDDFDIKVPDEESQPVIQDMMNMGKDDDDDDDTESSSSSSSDTTD